MKGIYRNVNGRTSAANYSAKPYLLDIYATEKGAWVLVEMLMHNELYSYRLRNGDEQLWIQSTTQLRRKELFQHLQRYLDSDEDGTYEVFFNAEGQLHKHIKIFRVNK